MWDKVVWIHPAKRRFRVRTGLTGQTLQQELTGSQTQLILARGATHAEYAALVKNQALSEFIAERDFSADVTFRHGYESFNVNLTGTKLVPVDQQGTSNPELASEKDGSYEYSPASAILV